MRNTVLGSGLFLMLSGCGEVGKSTSQSWDCMLYGERCKEYVERYESLEDGKDGTNGTNGKDGTDGPKGQDGRDGQDGADGLAGKDGQDGTNGSSCSAARVSNGVLISCTDGTSAIVLDGQNGTNGTNGQNAQVPPHAIVEVIDVCGNQAGALDEVLLRTQDGRLLAHYASGALQFLTVLEPGTYKTTDSTRCQFTVNANNQIVNQFNY